MVERWGVVGFGVVFSCMSVHGVWFLVCVCGLFIWLRINDSNN